MSTPILATKLYIPPLRPNIVLRPRLIERLNEGLRRKLTLVSAPAGFGKSTLLAEWLTAKDEGGRMKDEVTQQSLHPSSLILHPFKVAWLSLDEGDNDPARFLSYLVAALQTVVPTIGSGLTATLQSPQPPPPEAILTALLNEIATVPNRFVLVLDDYHVIDAAPIGIALTFLLEHLPPQMRLVIATREDPQLPLARLRARSQLTELRAADLRFTRSEAADFLNQAMRLSLSAEDIAALESRTEGWIAGLQLAALSLQGQQNASSFIASFTGSHRYVLDYLVEEVLHGQPEHVQTFLLHTSILERMCGSLCDAVLGIENEKLKIEKEHPQRPTLHSQFSILNSQLLLEELERANLFIIPLDNERRWYRYHHLFAELLRQRLQQSIASSSDAAVTPVAELHRRASTWFEEHSLELEAFGHAAAANDVERATRLIEGKGMPLHFRGGFAPVLNWLKSQPPAVLDARPVLWVTYATALLFAGDVTGVEQKLQAAEAALHGAAPDDRTRDLVGHIATTRATLAVTRHDAEAIIAQSRRALEYLHPDNLPVRTATTWTLGYAYQLQGDRTAARRAYTEAVSISQAIGHIIITIMSSLGLGNLQEADNQLTPAAETYQSILQLAGDPPLPVACEAHLGLARICYERNDLEAAQQHAHQSAQLAPQLANTDRLVACELFLARLKLAQGDLVGAQALVAKADQSVGLQHFVQQMSEVAATQVLMLLNQGNLATAADLAQMHHLPISRARVSLAQGDPSAALALLEPVRQLAEARGWQDQRLKTLVVQAVALHTHGDGDKAALVLGEALALAAPNGFIRLFVDEGLPMAQLLSEAAARGMMPEYIGRLLAALEAEGHKREARPYSPPAGPPQPLIEPLSRRELEVLQLIAEGRSNREISERLFLALSTVKGHTRLIFDKLQVQRRTEAVARARELGLL